MAFVDLRKTGKLSDISVRIKGTTMKLHKFPLVGRSKYFDGLVSSNMIDSDSVTLVDLPGGVEAFDLVADFCYSIDITPRITCVNVGPLVCAASYLNMTDAYSPGNLLTVVRERLDAIVSENAVKCLEVLNGSKIAAQSAEMEGIVEKCCCALANAWKEVCHFSKEEIRLVRELPRDWVLWLLAKLKEASVADGALLIALAYVCWSAHLPTNEELLQPTLTPKGRVTFFEALIDLVLPDDEQAYAADLASVQEAELPDYRQYVDWMFHALLFADLHQLNCRQPLLEECAFVVWDATISHCIEYPPELLADLNLTVAAYKGQWSRYDDKKDNILLGESYLLHHCRRGTIGTDGFHKIVSSLNLLRNPEAFATASFEALEALLKSSVGTVLSEEDISGMSKLIDFSRLSSDCLKRAASNSRIPKEIVLSDVLRMCTIKDQRMWNLVNSVMSVFSSDAMKHIHDHVSGKELQELHSGMVKFLEAAKELYQDCVYSIRNEQSVL
ncbi:uncharacterized protein [Oscarella lobularis]|uniref:uncharacterized protein n=1 Tax=Oscarella lobularis TaxID=121494 RepID=UPI00331374AA